MCPCAYRGYWLPRWQVGARDEYASHNACVSWQKRACMGKGALVLAVNLEHADVVPFQGDDVSAHVQCEMDPVEEVKIRGVIEASGLSVVGWYHSHPTFEPVPSQCDVDNQCNYQAFFRDHGAAVDPFVGLIVSPFDLRLPSMQSAVAWYHVSSPQTQPCPMVVDADIVFDLPSPPLPISCDGVVLAASLAEPPAPKRLDALVRTFCRLTDVVFSNHASHGCRSWILWSTASNMCMAWIPMKLGGSLGPQCPTRRSCEVHCCQGISCCCWSQFSPFQPPLSLQSARYGIIMDV